MGTTSSESESKTLPPVILDLGSRKKRDVKRLRNGKGKLMDRIFVTMEELKESGEISKNVQPVVIVVREKKKTFGLY